MNVEVPLLEQSPWWILPFFLLMLLMVHAMMEFTVSLLVRRPPTRRQPIPADALRQRLLEGNAPGRPDPLVAGKDCDLEIRWQFEKIPHPGRWAIARGVSASHLRILLDRPRHEVRIHQLDRSYSFFFGWTGRLPRLAGYASFQSGPPGQEWTKEFSRIAHRSGWSVRPVLWWFQATYRGHHLLQALTPVPLRSWSARRFWGILYPLSYILGMGYLVAILGSPGPRDLLLLVGISAGWWGLWGLLAWILCGFPSFWRRTNR